MRVLVVGEAPPASGRFFYRGDSGLYRAFRDAWEAVVPPRGRTFLEAFRARGWYLTDLCREPVDRLPAGPRRSARLAAEAGLARTLRRLRPRAVVVVVLGVETHVRKAASRAGWSGPILALPYPGRFAAHRRVFTRRLRAFLRSGV